MNETETEPNKEKESSKFWVPLVDTDKGSIKEPSDNKMGELNQDDSQLPQVHENTDGILDIKRQEIFNQQ